MRRPQQTAAGRLLAPLVACLLAALLATPAASQSGGGFTISQATVAGGGGTSTSGQTRLDGTVGQHATGASSGDTFSLAGGFWPAALALTPTISINDVSVNEGNSGASDAVFTVTIFPVSTQPITVTYLTSDGTATAPSDYTAIPPTVLNVPAGAPSTTITVKVNGDTQVEPDETFTLNLSNPTGAILGKATGTGTIFNDDSAVASFSFGQSNYSVHEACTSVALTVVRTGDASQAASVDYATSDGTAFERSDYTTAIGTLRFAPGEMEQQLSVLVSDDSFAEGNETFNVTLSNPSPGLVLGNPSVATVTIIDDASEGTSNVIDDPATFVAQHYHDFLNREPDAAGLQFWTNNITSCGTDAQCREVKRINVSAAFFLSIEFQQTGFLVYRLNQVAYGTGPHAKLRPFLADTRAIGSTPAQVVVGQTGWEQQLESNKQAFVNEFVSRPEFIAAYPASLTPAQYVNALAANTKDPRQPDSGPALTDAERVQLASDLASGTKTRAQVLRAIAENAEFTQREFNRAFVLMQYFGYLRRNPDSAPDSDFSGYNFWLSKLDQFNGNFVSAELVKAFIESNEYRKRFGL